MDTLINVTIALQVGNNSPSQDSKMDISSNIQEQYNRRSVDKQ